MGTMSYRKSVCSWFCRHRNKFIGAGVVVGGVIGGLKYAEYKVKTFIDEQNSKMAEEMKKQSSFENAQTHCASIIFPIMKTYEAMISSSADIDGLKLQLKEKTGNKVDIWNQLKHCIFTKLCSSLLWVIVIVIIVKVQFNQVAGIIYNNRSADVNAEIGNAVDEDQQIFLSLSQTIIIANDSAKLSNFIEQCVADITKTMPLQCPVDSSTLETTLHSVFHNFQNSFPDIDNGMMLELLNSCFPPSLFDGSYPNEVVQTWATKTIDIIDSPDCEAVFVDCLHMGLDFIKNELHSLIDTGSTDNNMVFNANTIPLAKSLPIINNVSDEIFSKQFIENLLSCPTLHEFSANVFESFLVQSKS